MIDNISFFSESVYLDKDNRQGKIGVRVTINGRRQRSFFFIRFFFGHLILNCLPWFLRHINQRLRYPSLIPPFSEGQKLIGLVVRADNDTIQRFGSSLSWFIDVHLTLACLVSPLEREMMQNKQMAYLFFFYFTRNDS